MGSLLKFLILKEIFDDLFGSGHSDYDDSSCSGNCGCGHDCGCGNDDWTYMGSSDDDLWHDSSFDDDFDCL